METRGREALLSAFDRLFDRAASKLNVEYTPQEKDEVKRHFIERYTEALTFVDRAEFPGIPAATMAQLETTIDELAPAHVAGYLAAAPLVSQVQEFTRRIALREAQQRLLEHLVSQADDTYGGN